MYTYVCIHIQKFLFLNKLPQKFSSRSTQEVIWIDYAAREKALMLLKDVLEYILCSGQWIDLVDIEKINSNIKLSNISL